jgi:hypothetical protein
VFPYAAALLFFGLLVYFIVLPPPIPVGNEPVLTMSQRIVIIVLIVMGSISIAIYPKLHYGFANGGLRQRTPWAFVIAAGALAAAFAVLANLEAGALLFGGMEGGWIRVKQGLPYMPSAVLTAGSIAWLIQDHRYRTIALAHMRRVCDALIFSGVWLIGSAISFVLLPSALRPPLLPMLAIALVLGAAMGALIPEPVRNPRLRGSDGTVIAPLSSGSFALSAAPAIASATPAPRVSV